jgi:A/G-specific adenine glycosylase
MKIGRTTSDLPEARPAFRAAQAETIPAVASVEELERARSIGRRFEAWYARCGREFPWRAWRSEYPVVIAEILLQRTRAEVVSGMIEGFLIRYPTWASLADASEAALEMELLRLGLHRRRARTLRAVGEMGKRSVSRPYEEWPGLGQYAARAVRVALDGARLAQVDANVVRIVRRAFKGPWKADYRFDERLQRLALEIVDGADDSRRVNWALLDAGALLCRPRKPRCADCPVRVACLTGSLA